MDLLGVGGLRALDTGRVRDCVYMVEGQGIFLPDHGVLRVLAYSDIRSCLGASFVHGVNLTRLMDGVRFDRMGRMAGRRGCLNSPCHLQPRGYSNVSAMLGVE